MGSSDSKQLKSEGVNQNLILNNELKVTNDDGELLLKVIIVLLIICMLYMGAKSLIKVAKKEQQRDNLIARNATAAPRAA